MKVQPRVQISDANQYIYTHEPKKWAAGYGGIVDQTTGAVWLSTVEGVRELKYNDWVVKTGDELRIMSREEVLARFEPIDWDQAYEMLGGTDWPGRCDLHHGHCTWRDHELRCGVSQS
jgi:hypothetical protein